MICSVEEFIALRTSEDPALYRRAAVEQAPDPVWIELIANHPEMRQWVAHNKTVSREILATLAADSDRQVRWMVAQKRSAGSDLLGELARDPDEAVRSRVANNPGTPVSVLRLLAMDPAASVAEIARERLHSMAAKPDLAPR